MATRKPFIDLSGKMSEMPSGDFVDATSLGSGGTSTDFLRKDNTWATPSGGPGTIDVKTVTLRPDNYTLEYTNTITDATVSTSSQVLIGWGNPDDTADNTPDMCSDVMFRAVPLTGQLRITIYTLSNNLFGGNFIINYIVG